MNQCKVSDYLLESEAAVLTGGVDLLGNPIVIIHPGRVQQCELVSLLLHYLKIMDLSQTSPPTITCVADLQASSKDDIVDLVEALESVEKPVRGRITALYLLKPKVKDRGRLLKGLLGLKTAKTYYKSQLFKVFLVKTRRELHKYIEISELPEELGGLLRYDHQAWLYFYTTVTPCIQAVCELLERLPDVRDRVELLQEYDLAGQSSLELTSLRQELLQTYQTLMREINLNDIIDQCKQTMHFLETPENSNLGLVHPRLVQEAVHHLRTSFVQIKEYQVELETLWDTASERLVTAEKIQKCRELANQIEDVLNTKYRVQLKEHPAIGRTLSQAELYRAHFTTAVYEPAKNLLNSATESLDTLTKLSAENPDVVNSCDDVIQQLSRILHPFSQQLDEVQNTYISVHVFHILLNKSMHWYKKVLKFLPDSLRQHVSQRVHNKLITTPREWNIAVKMFLAKRPSPREDHLVRMDSDIPHQIHTSLKQQAHTVALRIRFLNRLLQSKYLPVKLVLAAFKWKDEIFGRQSYQLSRRNPLKSAPLRRVGLRRRGLNLREITERKGQTSVCYSASDSGVTGHQSLSDTLGSYPVSTARTRNTEQDFDDLSQRYNKNWEELASPRQLNRLTERQPQSNGVHRQREDVYCSSSAGCNPELRNRAATRPPSSTGERFVKLNLTPNRRKTSRNVFTFDSCSQYDAGSESGIEVTENEDPYDSVMKKIRAVSASRLPNDLKLKYVSELISCSLKSETAAPDMSVSDQEGYQRRRLIKRTSRHSRPASIYQGRERLGYSMEDLSQSDTDRTMKRGTSLVDISPRARMYQPNSSLKCSFRPEDISLVLENTSGQLSSGLTKSTSYLSTNGLGESNRSSVKRTLSLDDLLDDSFTLSQSSWTFGDLESASSYMDVIDWSVADDRDSISSFSLQADLNRLRDFQEQRLAEVEELSEEQCRFHDIELNLESANQDKVAISLMRSQNILEQEEAALHQHQKPSTRSSQISDTSTLPVRLKKSVSGDQGYDSTTSLRTAVSNVPSTSDNQQQRRSHRATLDGPEFY